MAWEPELYQQNLWWHIASTYLEPILIQLPLVGLNSIEIQMCPAFPFHECGVAVRFSSSPSSFWQHAWYCCQSVSLPICHIFLVLLGMSTYVKPLIATVGIQDLNLSLPFIM